MIRINIERYFLIVILLCIIINKENIASAQTTSPSGEASKMTVAILDFESSGESGNGRQIAETLMALMTDAPGIQFVDRAAMLKILQEHELNLTGMVESDKAVRIGKLVGARILITGKIFALDKTAYITAKMISTETSRVEGVLVRGKLEDDIGRLIIELGEKLQKRLNENGGKLAATEPANDRLAELKARLAKSAKLKVAIRVKEEHHSTAVQAIDPAVETELRMMLQQCGFIVVGNDATAQKPDVIISGEAFSELAGRLGNMVSCSARIELVMTSGKNGQIILTDRTVARAVDLSEQIAAKNALQKGAYELGIRVLTRFAEGL